MRQVRSPDKMRAALMSHDPDSDVWEAIADNLWSRRMNAIQITPPDPPPTLAATALRLHGEHGEFTPEALSALGEVLDEYAGDSNGLFWAVLGLESAARRLAHDGDLSASERLLNWTQAQLSRYPELMEEVVALSAQREVQSDNLARTTGDTRARTAPRHDAPVPAGAKKLSELTSPLSLQMPRPGRKKP